MTATSMQEALRSGNVSNTEVLPTGGTTARTLADLFADVFNVKDYGAVPGGTVDAAAEIQDTIDAAEAAGGGIVDLPDPVYGIASGLVVKDNNVLLRGQGRGNISYGGKADIRASAGTTLKWIGAAGSGTMLKFTSDSNNDGTGTKKGGGGAIGLFIDADELALICFEMQSWSGGFFDLHCAYARTFGYKLWTLSNGLATGVTSSQFNVFQNLEYSEINTGQNPVGAILGDAQGGSAGNTSLNVFQSVIIRTDGSGNALELENTDGNIFLLVSAGKRTGSGGAVIFHADDTGQLSGNTLCRSNIFARYSAGVSLTVKATVAGSASSRSNIILGYSKENGGPNPTIEDGARLTILKQDLNFQPAGLARLHSIQSNSDWDVTEHAYKSANQTVNNSTVYVNDSHLTIDIAANQKLLFRALILYNGPATADFKVTFTIPAGATIRWGPPSSIKVDTADAVVVQNANNAPGQTLTLGAGTSVRELALEGIVVTGATAGAIQIQWAQNTAIAGDTIVHTGSYLEGKIVKE